jgi:DNA adenine methylase
MNAAAGGEQARPLSGTLMKYAGAKNRLAGDIISLFPPRYNTMTYLEPFFGSGAVFFKKVPGVVETINDSSGDIYNLFYQIRHNPEELARLVAFTPWSRREYEESYSRSGSAIEDARRFLVRCWFSIGSGSACRYGWRHNIKASNGGFSSFTALPDVIMQASRRLTSQGGNCVQIENTDALTLIEKYDRPNVLMYLDPPYLLSTRKGRKIYNREMADDDHVRLCGLIAKSSAKIVLSGYANELYDTCLPHFNKTAIDTVDEAGNQKREIVWRNFSLQGELFGWEAAS